MAETEKPKRARKPAKTKGAIYQEAFDAFMETSGARMIAEGGSLGTTRSIAARFAKIAADKARPTPKQKARAKREAAKEARWVERARRGLPPIPPEKPLLPSEAQCRRVLARWEQAQRERYERAGLWTPAARAMVTNVAKGWLHVALSGGR